MWTGVYDSLIVESQLFQALHGCDTIIIIFMD